MSTVLHTSSRAFQYPILFRPLSSSRMKAQWLPCWQSGKGRGRAQGGGETAQRYTAVQHQGQSWVSSSHIFAIALLWHN